MSRIVIAIVSVLSLQAASAEARAEESSNPSEFWQGAKPSVWTLRAGSYSDRFRNEPRQIPEEPSFAGAKPIVRTLQAGAKARPAVAAASIDPCWGMKLVVRQQSASCAAPATEGAAGREPRSR